MSYNILGAHFKQIVKTETKELDVREKIIIKHLLVEAILHFNKHVGNCDHS